MNEIREIVTKAIVEKGKKVITLNEKIEKDDAYSILGCFIINHIFTAKREEDIVKLEGSFELNIWYSKEKNTKTDIERKEITYKKDIKTKEIIKDYIDNNLDVMVKMLQHPTVTNAYINDGIVEVEIVFEALAEVVGETKMQVTISNLEDFYEEEEDFEDLIDENFIRT